MSPIVYVASGFVALQHVAFLVLEMFLWTTPTGRKVFRTTEEFATASAPLAMNQGLYNGFLAALIVASLARNDLTGLRIGLAFVIIAGLFGGATVNPRIAVIQALPAAIALVLTLL